jgi:hypothetical protein
MTAGPFAVQDSEPTVLKKSDLTPPAGMPGGSD